jgi:Mg2+-importing ATPase
VLRQLESSPRGLTEADAQERLAHCGENAVPAVGAASWPAQLLRIARDPFILVLAGLDAASALTRAWYSAAVISVLVALTCLLRLRQERRAGRAVAALRALVSATASVTRRATPAAIPLLREAPTDQIVPGDIVHLAPGDLIPADLRLIRSAGLTVSQAVLTGEFLPAAREPGGAWPAPHALPDCPWLCFAGTSVTSGSGTGVAVATGSRTYLAAVQPAGARQPETSFESGMKAVSWTLSWFMAAGLALMLTVTAAARVRPFESVAFLVAVAVGLTPEMMPVVITSALTRGATVLARLGVIVKRLPAIHNLGAMDVLCTDKTGTLTEGEPVLELSSGPDGRPSPQPLRLAVLNSYWCLEGPGGPACGPLDAALIKHAADKGLLAPGDYAAVAVIPFDPASRRATVILRQAARPGTDLVITKGAPADVLERCGQAESAAGPGALGAAERARLLGLARQYAARGIQVLAVAYAERAARSGSRQAAETGLVLAGFVGFADAPRPAAATAVRRLAACGVTVKVITGDDPVLAARTCQQAGITPGAVADGADLDQVSDSALASIAGTATVFARVRPDQKARIIRVLRAAGHVVGYLGDGVNDTAALREADVGICVGSAADPARESAEVILARKDLAAISDAVAQSRLAFCNIIKYLKITISANLGNVASMLCAAAVLPFLPMLPLQVLIQNLCFDLSQLTIVFDRVDEPSAAGPRTFDRGDLARFAVCFGLVNALADLATFAILRHAGGSPAAFRAGWFAENLLTQAITVLVLRARAGPSARHRPAWPVLAGAAGLAAVGLGLPLSPLAAAISMHAPPPGFLLLLPVVLGGYFALVLAARAACRKASAPWP